ncbi:MAG: hypothetical protein ACE5JB_04785 [bacterium]
MVSKLWESEKQRLTEILFRRVTQGKEKVVYNYILKGEFPEVFLVYVKSHACRLFDEEKPLRFSNQERYNLKSDQIKKQFEALKEILIRETLFSKEEIRRLIKIAVSFQYDALVRPRQTIIEILFKSTDKRNKDDVLVVIQGFGDDRPFIKKLVASIESTVTEIHTRQALDELTRQLETDVYNEKPISTFLKEIKLLIKFEASITGEDNQRVKSQVLLGMLKERDLRLMADGIEDEALSKDYWSFEEIENALERHILVGELEYFKSSETEKEDSDKRVHKRSYNFRKNTISLDAFDEIDTSLDTEVSEKHKHNNKFDTLRFQFVEEKSEIESDEKSSKLESSSSQKIKESKNLRDYEETLIINRRDIESQPPGPYPALHTLINHKDRKIFIKKIFHKDGQQYIEFIQRLEKQDKWKDAKAIIDAELEKLGISPYSKAAVLLGDVVFSRYFSKK